MNNPLPIQRNISCTGKDSRIKKKKTQTKEKNRRNLIVGNAFKYVCVSFVFIYIYMTHNDLLQKKTYLYIIILSSVKQKSTLEGTCWEKLFT